jgi:hypothetical protein
MLLRIFSSLSPLQIAAQNQFRTTFALQSSRLGTFFYIAVTPIAGL